MGVRTKTLITVLLVGSVVGIFALQVDNQELFKGQIFDQPGDDAEEETPRVLPDLSTEISVTAPEEGDENINIQVTIKNEGQGPVLNNETFEYKIFVNETEVLTNSDSFSTIEAGDSFTFNYPAPRKIYQYPDQGTVKVVVDTQNTVPESNESNNESTQGYDFTKPTR